MGVLMILLDVPYAEKDREKALGARWSADKKRWYVPEGVLASSFECWLPGGDWKAANGPMVRKSASAAATPSEAAKGRQAARQRIDGYTSKTIIGANYKEAAGAVGLPWDA